MDTTIYTDVKDYYGQELQSTEDLKTSACCSTESIPQTHKDILKTIHTEVLDKFYGCGSPIPAKVSGLTILDLGCGTGRDVYLLSKLVGPCGHVIGIDMTDEQLAVAKQHQDFQRDAFGYKKSNVSFKKGFIENLEEAGIEDNSVDLVISNCVINLSPNKEAVFSEIFRVLKPGGELYFSDVFSDRRISEALRKDPVLYGECLSGALYSEDFRRIMQRIGFQDFRVVSSRPLDVTDSKLKAKTGAITFSSINIRAFKLDLEDRCEDHGQVATFLGLPEHPHFFELDEHHLFEKDRPMLVCGNTADMLSKTRFKDHFRIDGDKSKHFGLFDCSDERPQGSFDPEPQPIQGSCC
ncbi:MAG: arsenite methyltransferase [Candidatus Marinamargulisbacteria bacterium]|jgi:arsenite methyltransferase